MTVRNSISPRAVWFLIALFLGIGVAPTMADEPDKPERQLQVLRLKHVDAAEAVKVLDPLFNFSRIDKDRVRIGVDARTNALIVSAHPKELMRVAEVIKQIDVDPTRVGAENPKITRVFALKHLTADKDLQQALRMVLDDKSAFAIDPRRNALIVRGNKSNIDAVGGLLAELDVPAMPGKATGTSFQVRIVWLMDGNGPKDAKAVPANLKDVQEELLKLGMTKLWLAGQCLVSVEPGADFTAQGKAKIAEGEPSSWSVLGKLSLQENAFSLQTEIFATKAPLSAPDRGVFGGGRSQSGRTATDLLCTLSTQITLTPGHTVLLGATPTSDTTSIFVVQVLPQRKKSR